MALTIFDLDPVLDVFANPHTEHLHDRQSAVLRRLIDECRGGFCYRQLSSICKLLVYVWSRLESGVDFFEPQLRELITLCAKPLLRERANEEFLGGLVHFEELVASLGAFLHVPFPQIQIATANALREISLGHDVLRTNSPPTVRVLGASGPVKEDLRPLPRELNQGVLLSAGVVQRLAQELKAQVG
jgi:hypothetical protein